MVALQQSARAPRRHVDRGVARPVTDERVPAQEPGTRLLYMQALTAVPVNLFVASIAVWLLWYTVPRSILLGWLAAHLVVQGARWALVLAYRRLKPADAELRPWRTAHVLIAGLTGIVWGMAGVLFPVYGSLQTLVIVSFFLGGMAAGAISTLASVMGAYVLFVLGVAVPMFLHSFWAWTDVSVAMGGMIVVFCIALISTARNYNRICTQALELTEKNSGLVRDVSLYNDLAQAANRKLLDEVQERHQIEAALLGRNRAMEALAKGSPLERVLTILVETVEEARRGMICTIMLLDRDANVLRATVCPGLPDFVREAADGFPVGPRMASCGSAAFLGERVICEDVRTHPNWVDYRALAERAGLRACWSQPIRGSNGEVLGTLAMYYREPRSPDFRDLRLIEGAADLAGIAIERRRAEQALRAQEHRYRAIYDGTPSMFLTVDPKGMLVTANHYGAEQLGYTVADLTGQPFEKLIVRGHRARFREHLAACLEAPGTAHRCEFELCRRDGSRMWVRNTARVVDSVDGGQSVLIVCEDITEARKLAAQLTYQATYDGLTGLVNRREFERRLKRVLESDQRWDSNHALCYLDLDQFKVINDTCGHVAGDELLRQLGARLQEQVGRGDTLARLGGDEFGVLLEHCPLERAEQVVRRLRKVIEDFRFTWDKRVFAIGVSIGMVPVRGGSGDIATALSAADNACYAAKEAGRNRIHIYQPDDAELARRRGEMQWVARIQHALEEDRFQLSYQPIVPVAGATSGEHYELLIRMRDEDGRLVSPGDFLPAAERYNLATRLDAWVITTALQWLTRNPRHLQCLHLCSINLSGQSLGDEEFLQFIIDQFKRTAVEPGKICFEVTETAAIARLSTATRFISELRRLGCRFALDDFGSGLSSFAYLKNLPVDFLKIDGAFVKDIVDDPIDLAMVKSISEIGRVMGKRTIAEFVENDRILEKLRELGVDYAQGYGIGRTRPIEELG